MPSHNEVEQQELKRVSEEWILHANHQFGNVYPKIKMSLESDFRNMLGFGISQT